MSSGIFKSKEFKIVSLVSAFFILYVIFGIMCTTTAKAEDTQGNSATLIITDVEQCTNRPVAGVRFDIESVGEVETDENGRIEIELPIGSDQNWIRVEKLTYPDGYYSNIEKNTVSLEKGKTNSLSYTERPMAGTIHLMNNGESLTDSDSMPIIDENDSSISINYSSAGVEGEKFEMEATENIVIGGRIRAYKGDIIAVMITNHDGYATPVNYYFMKSNANRIDQTPIDLTVSEYSEIVPFAYRGNYEVLESSPAPGYTPNNEVSEIQIPYYSDVEHNRWDINLGREVTPLKGLTEITVKDEETGQPVSNYGFKLNDSYGKYLCYITTGDDGRVVIKNIHAGEYEFTTSVPYKYNHIINPTSYEFTVIADQLNKVEIKVKQPEMENIKVHLTGINVNNSRSEHLSGAVYKLVAAEDICSTARGKIIRAYNGYTVSYATTGENGYAEFSERSYFEPSTSHVDSEDWDPTQPLEIPAYEDAKDLTISSQAIHRSLITYPGKYYIQEVSAPEGYELNEEIYPVELIYDEEKQEFNTISIDTVNYVKNNSVTELNQSNNEIYSNPSTGYESSVYLRVIVAAIMISMMIFIMYQKKQKVK